MTPSSKEVEPSPSRVRRLLLGMLLLSALGIRVWFASAGLDYGRAFDERYTLENIDSFLHGDQRPVNGWYPSLSYLPQVAALYSVDRIADLFGVTSWRLMKRDGVFSSQAILACRVLQAVYGTLCVLLVFLVARRLFDSTIGLVAALLLTCVPGHIQLSAIVKPDVLMTVLLLAVFLQSLRLLEKITPAQVLMAGALLGWTVAAKQYGVVAVLPLGAALLAQGSTWRRRAVLLGSTLATGAVVFLLSNPWVGILAEYAERNRVIYEGFSQGSLQVLVEALRFGLSDEGHGLAMGIAALGGLAVLGVSATIERQRSVQMTGRLLLLVTVAGYLALCLVFLRWAKFNLWVPPLAFTSIAAAFAVVSVFRWLRSSTVPAAAILVLVVTGASLVPGLRVVYLARVPTSEMVARDTLRKEWRNVSQRLVYQEKSLAPIMEDWKWHRRFVATAVDRLSDLSARRLDRADAELFPASRLDQPGGEFYRGRMDTHPEGVSRIESRWFRVRGEDLVLVEHAWQRLGSPQDLRLESTGNQGEFSGHAPEGDWRRGVVSLELWLVEGSASTTTVEIAGRPIRLFPAWQQDSRILYLTSRRRVPSGRVPISLRPAATVDREQESFTVRLHRWAPKSRSVDDSAQ